MVKRAAIITAVSKQQRQTCRRRLGTLRDNLVLPATRKRYAKHFEQFICFLRDCLGYLPATAAEYDEWLTRFIEDLWWEGAPKAVASNTLAAVQYWVPQLRHQLPVSWKLKTKWDSLEVACQAAPLTAFMLFAFVEEAFRRTWSDFAYLMILMFLAFLRTGEAMQLSCKHVLVTSTGVSIIVEQSKGAQRANVSAEEILISDALAVHVALRLLRDKRPGDSLAGVSHHSFRACWGQLVQHFQLGSHNFQPYSLRRGGATHFFRQTGHLNQTLMIGRWKHLSTARLYLKEAQAAQQSLVFSPSVQAHLLSSSDAGWRRLRRQMGTHGRGKQASLPKGIDS